MRGALQRSPSCHPYATVNAGRSTCRGSSVWKRNWSGRSGTLQSNVSPCEQNSLPAEQLILNAALASRTDNTDTIDLAVLGGLKDAQLTRLQSRLLAQLPGAQ